MNFVKEKPLKQLVCEACKKPFPIFVAIEKGVVSVDCKRCGHRNVIKK